MSLGFRLLVEQNKPLNMSSWTLGNSDSFLFSVYLLKYCELLHIPAQICTVLFHLNNSQIVRIVFMCILSFIFYCLYLICASDLQYLFSQFLMFSTYYVYCSASAYQDKVLVCENLPGTKSDIV